MYIFFSPKNMIKNILISHVVTEKLKKIRASVALALISLFSTKYSYDHH